MREKVLGNRVGCGTCLVGAHSTLDDFTLNLQTAVKLLPIKIRKGWGLKEVTRLHIEQRETSLQPVPVPKNNQNTDNAAPTIHQRDCNNTDLT